MANRLSIRGNGVTSTFESDITTIESIQPFAAKYRFNQYQTQGFCDIVRLMHDRWWFNCARFIKNIVNIWLRLRPTQMAKTVYVGTIGALTQHPGLVKSFRQ